jgi:hypothetical protein
MSKKATEVTWDWEEVEELMRRARLLDQQLAAPEVPRSNAQPPIPDKPDTESPPAPQRATWPRVVPSPDKPDTVPFVSPADEIEITKAMLEGGLSEFRAYDRRFDLDEDAVKAIYRAMESARRLSLYHDR